MLYQIIYFALHEIEVIEVIDKTKKRFQRDSRFSYLVDKLRLRDKLNKKSF